MGGRSEAQEGKHISIPIADSCGCTAESNITLQSNYSNFKNLIKLKFKIYPPRDR